MLSRALLLTCLLAAAAAAEDERSLHTAPEIGGRAVFYRPDDSDGGTWGKGGQLKVGLGQYYAGQLSLDHTRHSWAGSNFRVLPLQASLVGFFTPESPASFYLLAGYGWYWTSVDGPGAHTKLFTRPHAGGGLEIVGEKWSLDASWRFLWSQVYRFNDWGRPYGSAFRQRGTMWTLALSRHL